MTRTSGASRDLGQVAGTASALMPLAVAVGVPAGILLGEVFYRLNSRFSMSANAVNVLDLLSERLGETTPVLVLPLIIALGASGLGPWRRAVTVLLVAMSVMLFMSWFGESWLISVRGEQRIHDRAIQARLSEISRQAAADDQKRHDSTPLAQRDLAVNVRGPSL